MAFFPPRYVSNHLALLKSNYVFSASSYSWTLTGDRKKHWRKDDVTLRTKKDNFDIRLTGDKVKEGDVFVQQWLTYSKDGNLMVVLVFTLHTHDI